MRRRRNAKYCSLFIPGDEIKMISKEVKFIHMERGEDRGVTQQQTVFQEENQIGTQRRKSSMRILWTAEIYAITCQTSLSNQDDWVTDKRVRWNVLEVTWKQGLNLEVHLTGYRNWVEQMSGYFRNFLYKLDSKTFLKQSRPEHVFLKVGTM